MSEKNYFKFDPSVGVLKTPWYKKGFVYRLRIIIYLLWRKVRNAI